MAPSGRAHERRGGNASLNKATAWRRDLVGGIGRIAEIQHDRIDLVLLEAGNAEIQFDLRQQQFELAELDREKVAIPTSLFCQPSPTRSSTPKL
jgi:hypothetical protein